ncbi:MAG: DUF2917 domain-containing protein [Betaproteobacteria bacterium]|nr:DUF2917 domain-containing protein [Betaproteobacteria bacterium]
MELMNLRIITGALTLQPSGLLRLDGARGVTLRCLSGRLWITEEGGGGDVFLAAGEFHRIGHGGVTLIEALEPAQVVIEAPRAGVLPALATA